MAFKGPFHLKWFYDITLCCSEHGLWATQFLFCICFVPFSVCLKDSRDSDFRLLWQTSILISQGWFSSEAIINSHSISCSISHIYSVYVRSACFKAPIGCLNWFSELGHCFPLAGVTSGSQMAPESLQCTWWELFSWDVCSYVPQVPLHL